MYFNNSWRCGAALALLLSLLTACGGGGGGETAPAALATPVLPAISPLPSSPSGANVLSVTVDAGPTGSGANVNRLYATVTICEPGSASQCQTIDHVLVDTGSIGLRLLSSVLASNMKLPRLSGTEGFPLLNCAQFVDNSYAWGPVASVDLVLGGKTALNVPIQLIADPAAASPASACSVGGTQISTQTSLGAKGIIGLGMFQQDCGSNCVTNTRNGYYYTCTSAACSATTGSKARLAMQITQPVPLFSGDNNGVLIDLPAVAAQGANSLAGSLIFGVGTQSNNQPGAGLSTLTTGASGYFTTLLTNTAPNSSYSVSFIDTGSNGIYFDTNALPACVGIGMSGFYCPSGLADLSATLTGANAATQTVPFFIGDAVSLFADESKTVLPTLGGNIGSASMFDWGLPFYYGRRVFMGIEGQASNLGAGLYFAF